MLPSPNPAILSIVPTPLLTRLAPTAWAEATFGTAQLGDARRTRRLVQTAAALAARPCASLPEQLGSPAALKATYRLLDSDAVRFAAIIAPHQQQTRAAATAAPVVLLVQDMTTLDMSAHPATTGLGPIGPGDGHGFHLHTVLAVSPASRLPLGVLAAEVWVRQRAPVGETHAQRQKRSRESDVWGRLVQRVGPPPAAGCMSPTGGRTVSPSCMPVSRPVPTCWCGWSRIAVSPRTTRPAICWTCCATSRHGRTAP